MNPPPKGRQGSCAFYKHFYTTPKGRQGSHKHSDTSSSKVSYSGLVEWISPSGVFTSFREQGWKTTDNTTIIFSPLTPSTAYVFRVNVVTEDGQSGAEVTSTVTTSSETGGMHNNICKAGVTTTFSCDHQYMGQSACANASLPTPFGFKLSITTYVKLFHPICAIELWLDVRECVEFVDSEYSLKLM